MSSRALTTARLVFAGTVATLVVLACGSDDEEQLLHFHGEGDILPGFNFDTGLQPKDSPVQAAFVVSAVGKVTADADAKSGGSSVVGKPGSGKLAIAGGFKLEGKLKIDVSGVPKKYDGPIPNLDNVDLKFGGVASFDPFLLGGKKASVTADVPETKLPEIPLPGGITGKLLITIVAGSKVDTELSGVCAGIADGKIQYLAKASTTGQLKIKPTVIVSVLGKEKPFDLPEIPVTIPAKDVPLDLGTRALLEGDTPSGDPAATATRGSCSGGSGPAEDGGLSADGGPHSEDGGSGAVTSDPQRVPCGSVACNTTSEYCCATSDGGGACTFSASACAESIELHCDEAADCPTGQVCCGEASFGADGAKLATICRATCAADDFTQQACKTDAECSNKQPCVPSSCRGHALSTCGALNPNAQVFCQ